MGNLVEIIQARKPCVCMSLGGGAALSRRGGSCPAALPITITRKCMRAPDARTHSIREAIEIESVELVPDPPYSVLADFHDSAF